MNFVNGELQQLKELFEEQNKVFTICHEELKKEVKEGNIAVAEAINDLRITLSGDLRAQKTDLINPATSKNQVSFGFAGLMIGGLFLVILGLMFSKSDKSFSLTPNSLSIGGQAVAKP